ncbi:MAG: acyl-CoA dehydrogenase [Mesorhizobium sp.]|uniref:acyl-CoA dehydrogenase n=3 Tax=unclassified Mesorhizobium TaxID=325217 RepID=UPI000FE39B86|nr:acyl-CoA dehydrogenase [Mesorhizobium sp.]RWF87572.1 MAG: acyl-CoA dehydrogenase [Mesorhizobium sp.]RWF92206.1 MAG: acyl-CoA dehydrogenase [Mesorhizobium sp.]RWI42305.1 MAG: acyl-CoA dehydrogenase [Mesorhizobium sp.]RWI47860.1 MAG: acyl-CoA dehydrogenase [Mesorhizobium sp.]RWI53628.1 MAG: acyl-CoA dehydrogenase [Mesorhizobium sp.]
MSLRTFRRDTITRPIFKWASRATPPISGTERDAIEAGTVWWDGELFTGNPDWNKLLAMPPAKLSAEEQAFMDGPVRELCAMVNDWNVNWEDRDLPREVWDFLREKKFFGMIIPKKYGGLGFSNTAHSEVVRTVSSCSVVAGVTVMVPNSLGPGELLMHFGTDEQRDYWLPRLADGREIPCFALTSPDAGSDAAAMTDTGIVEYGEWEGEKILGIRLNFHKRYITLGPIATVVGLAFKMYDPENHLGRGAELGITVALLPTSTPGVTHGERHIPQFTHFQNGPLYGKDVFLPLDLILGGEKQIGEGWKMLMTALAAGRGISLPSQSAAAAAICARATGAYARVRTQFDVPIGMFEGIRKPLADLAANIYLIDAARRLTIAALDERHRPSVISAIIKFHATEHMRESVEKAMDIHGGKSIIDGPRNYLGSQYRSAPIGITVEGANILTRNLMIFGQGAVRSHPYMLKEMLALADEDEKKGLDAFDKAIWRHLGHAFATAGRAFVRGWSGGRIGPAPDGAAMPGYWKQLSRHAAAFALLADFALLTLGGALKRKEMISARLGDVLAELYLLGAVLKRFETEGRREEDRPIVAYVMRQGQGRMAAAFAGVLDNLPARWAAYLVRLLAFPVGVPAPMPSDELTNAVAETLMKDSPQRDRLTPDIYLGEGHKEHPLKDLEQAFKLVTAAASIEKKMREEHVGDPQVARDKGIISAAEFEQLAEAKAAADRVVAVDAFPMEEVSPIAAQHRQKKAARNKRSTRSEAAE